MKTLLACIVLITACKVKEQKGQLSNPSKEHSQIAANKKKKNTNMNEVTVKSDMKTLSELNAQFIKNFIEQDTVAHNQIIYKDFVCIENNGTIVGRDEYMKGWTTDYSKGNFISFSYTDEFIRIFGDAALVRSKTIYSKIKDGQLVTGSSIYTDTYIKENGRWWCIQAQITPVQQ